PAVRHSTAGPRDHLVLTVFGDHSGSGRLYDDAGQGFGYQRHAYAWTGFRSTGTEAGDRLRIGAVSGTFPGALPKRSWTVHYTDIGRPSAVTVDGVVVRWHYDPNRMTLTIDTPEHSVDRPETVRVVS
ncbi:MAG: DUF5110 domain-containing protein, partial [Mycobacteriales bacterium]